MKTIKYQMLLACALLSGVAIGYFAAPRSAPVPAERRPSPAKKTAHIADVGDSAEIAALKSKLKSLETAAKEMSREMAVSQDVARAAPPFAQRGNPREWLERLEKENPARYAQITNGMARWRNRQLERAQAKLDFLSSIDVSKMSDAARQTHVDLQEVILRREEIEDRLHDRNIGEEERAELWKSLREIDRDAGRLYSAERQNLLKETARNLGLKGAAAKEFADTMKEIFSATEGGHFGPPGRRGR